MARRRGPALRGSGPERGTRGGVVDGVTHVLVDGRNVQGALRRGSGSAAVELPEVALVARLRAAFAGLEVRLVLDGHPGGGPSGRIAPRFAVEYSRHREADEVIRDIVVDGARQLGPAGMDTILVVSDDGEVRASARRHGARVEGTGWLLARMERVATRPSGGGTPGVAVRAGTTIGHARPPRGPRPPDDHRGR